MLKINILKIIHILMILTALLMPIQAMFVYLFKLPNFVQLIYLFILIGLGLCFFIPIKKYLNKIDKTFVILFSLFLLSIVISMIINYNEIINLGMDFIYFCKTYSNFWDRPNMRLLNWGLIRPLVFFIYILLLLIFIQFKKSARLFIKSLIILSLCSCFYSIYQILAHTFNLPFGALFSGHNGEPIIMYGLRRVEGLFYEPGPQATFLSPIFCILLSQLFETKKENLLFKKTTITFFLCLITFTLFMTLSPIGFLTPFVSIPLFFILNKKTLELKKKHKKKIINITLILAILLSSITFTFIQNKNNNFVISKYMIEKIFISTKSMDSPIIYKNPDSRSVRNYVGLEIFKNHKLFGVSQGGAIFYFSKYSPFANSKKMPETNGVINTHIKILCELGIIGTFFYILILGYPFYLYAKKIFCKLKYKLLIDGLLIGYLIYLLISFQSTLQFWMPYFWMIYVLLIVLLKRRISFE